MTTVLYSNTRLNCLLIGLIQVGNEFFKYADVYPANVTSFTLGGLTLGTEYLFSIMAFNDLGDSNYTQDIVKARTSSKSPLPFIFFFFIYD